MAHEEAEEDVAIPAGDLFPSSGDDEDPFFTEALPPSAAFEEGVTLKPNFSDADGSMTTMKEDVRLPDSEWYWMNEWEIELGGDVDANGWQYCDKFEGFDGPRAGGFAAKKYDDYVRRRRWVRTGVKLEGMSSKGSRKHMLAMAARLSQMEDERTAMLEFNAKMAEELQSRLSLVNEYEEKIRQMQDNMAIAAATGNLKHIGAGTSGARVVGGGGDRVVRSIRGGGGTAAGGRQAAGAGGGEDADDSKLGWLARFKRRLSPAKANTPMPGVFKAAERGNVAELAKLVSSGVSINLEDKSGRTPLLYAARGGQLAAIEWLVAEQHADLEAMDKEGRNALHYAARRGHMEVAAWLLKRGLPFQQTDVHALTPLHQATLGRSRPLCELLLRHGADINARDANGHTALELASRFEASDDAHMADTMSFLRTWAVEHP